MLSIVPFHLWALYVTNRDWCGKPLFLPLEITQSDQVAKGSWSPSMSMNRLTQFSPKFRNRPKINVLKYNTTLENPTLELLPAIFLALVLE